MISPHEDDVVNRGTDNRKQSMSRCLMVRVYGRVARPIYRTDIKQPDSTDDTNRLAEITRPNLI